MKYNETHQADALASSWSHAAGSRFLRRAAASLLMLFTFGITSSFAEDYVFMTGTDYFYVNGSKMSLSSSFSPSLLWSGTSGSTFASNGYYLGCTRSGDKKYTYTPTINTSVPSFGQNITIDGSNRLTFSAPAKSSDKNNSTYYYNFNNNSISASTDNANAILAYPVTTAGHDDMTLTLKTENDATTLSVNNSLGLQVQTSGYYKIPYITYSFNNTTHYWYYNADHNAAPTEGAEHYDLNNCQYTWTIEGEGADYATISGWGPYSASVTYNSASTTNKTLTIKVTLTDSSAGFSKTLSTNITLTGSSIGGYYYIQNKGDGSYYLNVSGNNYNNNSNTPYLKGSTQKNDESIWYIEKVGNQYRIIHASTGKYVVSHATSDANGGQLVHLETVQNPGNNTLFTFRQDNDQSYRICPGNYNRSLNEYGGHGSDIGLYDNIENSRWVFVPATPSVTPPSISFNNEDNKVTISCTTAGADIYYTTDGSVPTTSSTKYTAAFTQTSACTIKAIAYKGAAHSNVTMLDIPKVATPEISEDANKNIQITCATEGATIYYKTAQNGQYSTYSAPFAVNNNTRIWAYASKTGSINSDEDTYTFTTTINNPVISRVPGTTDQLQITVEGGGTIHFTTDGSTPTSSSATYSGPITQTVSPMTVKAIAIGWGLTSEVVSATFQTPCAPPVITFVPNTSDDGQTATATITCDTQGATIYYTTDGTTPTASSTEYTGSFIVNNLDVVKAIAVMTGANASYYDDSNVAELMYSAQKVPTPTINVRGNEVTFLCDEPGVTFYYTTNGSDPTTSSRSWTTGSAAITNISAGATIKVIATKTGFAPSEVASTTLGEAHVVYLRLAGAQGNGSGSSSANAVGTWAAAFAKLGYGPNAKYLREQWAAHGDNNLKNLANNAVFNNATYTSTVDNNIIYLVGDVTEDQFGELMKKTPAHPESEYGLMNPVVSSGYFKPVTISGKYANSNSNREGYARINIYHEQKYYLNEDMRFEYVEFYGDNGASSTDFMLCYYDLEMGDGIIMNHFYSTKDFNTYHHGYAQGVTNTSHILFYGGHTNDARFGHTDANALDYYDYYLPHPSGYKITIRSGYFSTISPGGTQWNQYNDINGAMGSPKTPVKCTITVDIDRAWNTAHQSRVLGNGSTPDCDVAVVIAGTHEGTIFGDVDINIKSGRIDRVVNGTFGANYFVGNYPADSYFGRANILVDPREPSSAEASICQNKNDMVVIRELYGGGLGRFKSDSNKDNQSSTYFYGKSSVTINGGTFKSAIYASGAGGVNGVGDANHHTNDARLPYLNGTTLTYGTWADYNRNDKLGITCHVGRPDITKPDFHTNDAEIEETVYLSDTQANIQIHGGVFGSKSSPIEGIFGGGYGFVDTELINYTGTNGAKPNTRAGAIFATAGKLASSVTIDGDAEIYGNIYGAGRGDSSYKTAGITYNNDDYTQLGQVSGNVELTIGGNAKIYGSVYGAGKGIEGFENMARLYGNTTLTIGENAVITGTVYGGGQNGTVDKNNGQYGNTQVNIGGGQVTQDVYGGGALANVSGNTEVNLTAGKVDGDVYGGGLGRTTGTPIAALVNGNATTTLDGTIIGGSIFGANNVNGTPQGHVKVDVKATTPREGQTDGQYDVAAVYGGGNQADYVPTNNNDYAEVFIENCDNSIEYVYGGGNAAAVPQAKVTINGGTFNYVFAGGNGAGAGNPGADVGYKNHTNTEYGTGTATAIVHGGVINHLFAGSNERGRIRVSQSVSVDHESSCNENILEVYGGGNLASSNAGLVTINCGAIVGDVYGGANQANITSDIVLNVTGGTINRVFGGNNTSGNVSGSITVNVNKSNDCDLDLNYVYGGGNQAAYTPTTPGAYPVVNILNGTVKKDVFGGGLGATAVVTSNPQVTVNGGNITGNVFGGGSQANTDGNTTINIKNGSVGNAVYGGGALANTGNTTVNLLGGTVHDVYGGGLGQLADAEQGLSAVAATVGTATVNVGRLADGDTPASGSVITGNVFGCNNLNGTPTGNATVNVYKTVAQPGAAAGAYHVAAVYGGGNKAAYIPADASLTSTNTTKVEVFACDNSIQYVYGGGNAASTPATNVIINGGKFDYVFGGGNGKTEPGQPENPGANVGYYQDTDINNPKSHGAEYGSGMAITEIHDGVINHIFGGSNTRGNIRYAAITQLEHIGCDFYIGEVYAAGNEAYMDGKADLNIGCIPGIGVVYGGARKADIPNDVEMNINSGTYGQVFGGNKESGSIYGTITINIEETGCNPVIIGEVYGGGYYAPYPGNIPSGVTTGITINAYSFTQIGTIYGGGYGETAVVTGDPTVNVNQVKGIHAGTTPNGGTPIPDELGVIGTVFGGGNAAKVIGNTNVNIATSDKYTVISGDNKGKEKAIEGANIQSVTVVIPEAITGSEAKTYSGVGNVYGGGNKADVTGKTNVQIGNDRK